MWLLCMPLRTHCLQLAALPAHLRPASAPRRPLPAAPTADRRTAPPAPAPRSDLLAAVKEEVAQVLRIFAHPKLALELFLQRIFEQKVQFALERLLQAPAPNAPAAAQQNYLQ
jgi:hypothetical protein